MSVHIMTKFVGISQKQHSLILGQFENLIQLHRLRKVGARSAHAMSGQVPYMVVCRRKQFFDAKIVVCRRKQFFNAKIVVYSRKQFFNAKIVVYSRKE